MSDTTDDLRRRGPNRIELVLLPGTPDNVHYEWRKAKGKVWECWKSAPGFNQFERREGMDASELAFVFSTITQLLSMPDYQ